MMNPLTNLIPLQSSFYCQIFEYAMLPSILLLNSTTLFKLQLIFPLTLTPQLRLDSPMLLDTSDPIPKKTHIVIAAPPFLLLFIDLLLNLAADGPASGGPVIKGNHYLTIIIDIKLPPIKNSI